VASTAPAMQAFNNKHRDMAAAQQAPQGMYVVSASPRHPTMAMGRRQHRYRIPARPLIA
jgi:hypothetical protein